MRREAVILPCATLLGFLGLRARPRNQIMYAQVLKRLSSLSVAKGLFSAIGYLLLMYNLNY